MNTLLTLGGLIIAIMIVTVAIALPATDPHRGDAYDADHAERDKPWVERTGAWSVERAAHNLAWIPLLWVTVFIIVLVLG